jgi:hypothetical protein
MATTERGRLALTGDRLAMALVVSGIVSIVTLGTAFALLALGIEFFWVVYPVGFGGVLPIALGLVALRTTADG